MIRWVAHGMMITMEFSEEWLTVHLSPDGRVAKGVAVVQAGSIRLASISARRTVGRLSRARSAMANRSIA